MTQQASSTLTEHDLWEALRDVPDPELPVISVVDLGVILQITLDAPARRARVLLMPTFMGCPALETMRADITERLAQLGLAAQVELTNAECWTSDRISELGRARLAQAGIAPPGPASSAIIPLIEPARCPYCGSSRTSLDSAFGPTRCRAIAYCHACRQPFEQFKPV